MNNKKEVEIYGYITNVILSTKLFKSNIDIKEFLEEHTTLFQNDDEKFKDYIYKTRTLILARVIRITERRQEKDKLFIEFHQKYLEIFDNNLKTNNTENSDKFIKKRKKKNKFNDLLDQFDR